MTQEKHAHTPGRWRFEADKGIKGHWTVWADVGGVKTFVADCYDGPEAKKDARLIAAAPAMLEALRDAELSLEQLCEGQHEDNVCCHHLRAVRAAIALATGKEGV